MNIGRKVYYEKTNGVVLWDKGEMSGAVHETTLKQDIISVPALSLVPEGQLGVVQFAYGAYAEEFATSRGFRINPATQEPEFVAV
jgi:hypothetical protein